MSDAKDEKEKDKKEKEVAHEDKLAEDSAEKAAVESSPPPEAPMPEQPMAADQPLPADQPMAADKSLQQPPPTSASAQAPPPQDATQAPAAPQMQAPQEQAPQPAAQAPMTPMQEVKKRTMDEMAFAGDLGEGKIHPKTYSEWAHDKGTSGRIGTIFGLLLSGAGSGLSHQPNAAMEMMNKEIERDFEAQKQNQTNRQSWYKMAMEHERYQAENALTRAHAAGVDFENMSKEQKALFDKWQNRQVGVTEMLGTSAGLNYSTTAYLRMMQDEINKMPAGPAKEMMQQRYNQEVVPFFTQKMQMRTADAVGKKALVNATNPLPSGLPKKGGNKKVSDEKRYQAAPVADMSGIQRGIQLGRVSPFARGAVLPEDGSAVLKEVGDVQQIRRAGKRWEEAYNKLNNLPHKGESASGLAASYGTKFLGAIPGVHGEGAEALGNEAKRRFERERAAIINGLKSSLPAGTADERAGLVEAYLPRWGDSSAVEKTTFEGGLKHFRDLERTPTLDKYPQYKLKPQEYSLDKQKPDEKSKGKGEVKIEDGHVYGKSGKKYK